MDVDFLEWLNVSTQLKELKTKEMKLRKNLCSSVFDGKVGAFKKKFTAQHDGVIFQVKAQSKITESIDEAVLDQIWNKLDPHEKECIKVSHSISKNNYKQLDEKSIFHECVVSKPAAPTLKVEILNEGINKEDK